MWWAHGLANILAHGLVYLVVCLISRKMMWTINAAEWNCAWLSLWAKLQTRLYTLYKVRAIND